jgi:hypothetical protein
MCLSFFDFQRGVGTPFAKEANMVNKQLKHRSNIKTITLTLRDLSKKNRLFQPPQDYGTRKETRVDIRNQTTSLPRDPKEPPRRSSRTGRAIACSVIDKSASTSLKYHEAHKARLTTYPSTGATSSSTTSSPSYIASALASTSPSPSRSSSPTPRA